MAVPAYTTDLVDIADLETSGGTAVEPLSLYTAGRSPIEDDEDMPIQGTYHASLTFNTTGSGGLFVPGDTFTYSAGDYIFGWVKWTAPSTIDTYANGGLSILLGSSASVFNVYWVSGSDRSPNPYGGWQNIAILPTLSPNENAGSPTAYHYVGCGAKCIKKVSKGNPLALDAFRYGRGEVRVIGGSSGDGYATFAGIAAVNDASLAKWGLFQEIDGGYKWKGLMSFGYGSLTEFVDSNTSIVIENSEWVSSNFNRIEINNAGSTIDWTAINITALGTTSKGALEMIDNATVDFNSCVFTDMDTFIFQSNATLASTTFRRCNQTTLGGATITGCTFDSTTAAIALACGSSISGLSGTTFISDGSSHALEITSGTSHTLNDLTFTGYESYQAGGTSTGNEAVFVNIGSGDVTLYADAQFSYRSAGANVTIVAGAVDTTINAIDVDGNAVNDVSVSLFAKDATGDLPYQASISISNSGTTATVTHTGHGMITNDKVLIQLGDQPYNRGVFSISVSDANTYTYTMLGTPSGDPTGCTCTWASIYETLSSTNTVTKSRTFATNQPVSGWVRKSTSSPYYKTAPVAGTIDTSSGLTLTALMLLDE